MGGLCVSKVALSKIARGRCKRRFFLLTHSVVASTSDSGSDNGGSSPPGSTWQFG